MFIRLSPDVKRKLIQLLAIEEDANREFHVGHDTFRTVAMEILNGHRNVTVAKPSQASYSRRSTNSGIVIYNYGNINIHFKN